MSATVEAVRVRTTESASRRLWIPVGAGLFIIALTGSAVVVPQLRVLHVLQALIYVAVPILAWRKSVWGLGAGITIAVLWNGLELFVTHNMQKGIVLFWAFLRSGQGRQFDTMLVPLGGIGHFILIAACISSFFEAERSARSWWKLIGGGVAVLAYFFLIVAVALPRAR